MSDLTATNCNCNSCNNTGVMGSNGFGGCSWIILLLLFCGGGCGNGCGNGILGGNNGCGNNNNNCCEWIIWILLLSCFCGGNNNGCGSSCC